MKRHAKALLVVPALVCSAVFALGAPSAQAATATLHPFESSFGGPFAGPSGIAIDQSDGSVYITELFAGINSTGAVDKFDAGGAPVGAFGTAGQIDGSTGPPAPFSFFDPTSVAVDNTVAKTHSGDIYVTDSANNVVDIFDDAGAYKSQLDGTGAPAVFSDPCGVAVDANGTLYVADRNNNVVDIFDETGAYLTQIATELDGPCGLAVDSTGNLYVRSANSFNVVQFTPGTFPVTGATTYGAAQTIDANNATAVAVDPSNDDVYVDNGFQISQYVAPVTPGEPPLSQFGGEHVGDSHGVDINGATGKVYASDNANGNASIFKAAVQVDTPTATLDPIVTFDDHSAHFSGKVNSQGTGSLSDTTYHFECSPACPGLAADQPIPTDGADHTVIEDAEGLVPNTEYTVNLVAQNAASGPTGGPTVSTQVFTTTAIGPEVRTDPVNDVGLTHAAFMGVVNPHHSATTYYFEYGTTTAYGSSFPATEDASAGSGPDTVAAIQRIDGLNPGTAYHYRLVADNGVGSPVKGGDQSFTTTTPSAPSAVRENIPGTGFLPDNRGWEEVSPPQKHGSDVMDDSSRTRAAAAETASLPMAATFTSLGGFGDVQGFGIATEYMGVRSTDPNPGNSGWTTHAITPTQKPLQLFSATSQLDPAWEGDFSANLTAGAFRAYSPLTDAPNVVHVENLYQREDLRTSGAGIYHLLSDCLACGSTPLPQVHSRSELPWFAGASSDFSHVIFESTSGLTADATSGTPNLYEWANGTLRLAAILPDNACASPPCPASSSIAGQGAGAGLTNKYTPHTISADGSRVFFTDNSSTGGETGSLYMRTNGANTVQINASEKTNGTGPGGTDAGGPQPATYWDATPSGSRAYFTTSEQLTNDDTDGTVDLYMYDSNGSAGNHLTRLSVDHEPADQAGETKGVIGTSDDGRYVYFLNSGQLVPGEPTLGSEVGVYEWHDGIESYVGELLDPGRDITSNLPVGNWTFVIRRLDARVTPDGGHLLFTSHSGVGLTGYDQANCGGLPVTSSICTMLTPIALHVRRVTQAGLQRSGKQPSPHG